MTQTKIEKTKHPPGWRRQNINENCRRKKTGRQHQRLTLEEVSGKITWRTA